jgi:hypothetical protein
MSAFQKKAEAQTKEIIGQMLGDGDLIEEARAEYREAAGEAQAGGHQGAIRGPGQAQPLDKELAHSMSRIDRERPGHKHR